MKLTSKQLDSAAEAMKIVERMDAGKGIEIHVGNDEECVWEVSKDDELYPLIRKDVVDFLREMGIEP